MGCGIDSDFLLSLSHYYCNRDFRLSAWQKKRGNIRLECTRFTLFL